MTQVSYIISIMLPENNKGGNQEKWWLLASHSLQVLGPGLGQTFAVNQPSSPASPAACKLHNCKYNSSLLETN